MDKQQEIVMYIILNKDLRMSTGKAAAQASHVVVNYMEDLYRNKSDEKHILHQNWLANGQTKVVLGAKQKEMEKLCTIPGAYSIHDEGRTEIPANSLTAICLAPIHRASAPKEIKRLQPYKDT